MRLSRIDPTTLPLDTEDFATLQFELERLDPDTPESCIREMSDIEDYVRRESGDLDQTDFSRMIFVRTAKINDGRAWIWRLIESNGEEVFVIVTDRGGCDLGLVSNWEKNLSPEQWLVAFFFDRVY